MSKLKPLFIIIAAFLSFAAVLTLIKKSMDSETVPTATQPKHKVYLITMDKRDRHWHTLNNGAAKMAELLEIEYIWMAPETRDTTKQIEAIYQSVEEGADLIMLAANDPVVVTTAIEDAKAQGVLFIYVDSPANEEAITTLTTNNYFAGVTAGEAMLGELDEKEITDGFIGILGVSTGTNSTMNRELGFRNVIERDGRFQILRTEYMEGDPVASEQASAKMIAENPTLIGLFGTNEGSTEGVGKAIRANKPELIGIGFDRSEENLNLIRVGGLQAVLAQNPYTMGYLGMAEAYAALEGLDTGPKELNTGISLLRKRQ